MKKYFCDRCETEITLPKDEYGLGTPMVTGFLDVKNKHFNTNIRIWINFEDDYVKHLCRDCLIDGIKALDWRRPPTKIQDDDLWEEEGDSEPYQPAPAKKPKRIPSGLDKLKGIVE